MEAKVVRTYKFNEEQIKKFMEAQGWEEDEEYTEDDVESALMDAYAEELESFSEWDYWDQECDVY